MRSDLIDLTGQRFGQWLVLRLSHEHVSPRGGRHWYWLCRCDCGARSRVAGRHLRYGRSTKCLSCREQEAAERARFRSRRVGDGRTVAQIAAATGLKPNTVYQRLYRGWKPWQLAIRPLRRGETRS